MLTALKRDRRFTFCVLFFCFSLRRLKSIEAFFRWPLAAAAPASPLEEVSVFVFVFFLRAASRDARRADVAAGKRGKHLRERTAFSYLFLFFCFFFYRPSIRSSHKPRPRPRPRPRPPLFFTASTTTPAFGAPPASSGAPSAFGAPPAAGTSAFGGFGKLIHSLFLSLSLSSFSFAALV